MKEILFRGKRIDNDEWVEGYYVKALDMYDKEIHVIFDTTATFYSFGETSGFELIDPETICQYTELNDKNAEPIYKNDIVDFLGHRGIVKFEFGTFGIFCEKHIDWDEIQANIMPVTGCENLLYVCKNDNFISLWEIYWNFNDEDNYLSTVEVIGNVYDNPELLEVQDGETDKNIQ